MRHLRKMVEACADLPDDAPVLVHAIPFEKEARERVGDSLLTVIGAGPGGRRVEQPGGPRHERMFVLRCDYPASELP